MLGLRIDSVKENWKSRGFALKEKFKIKRFAPKKQRTAVSNGLLNVEWNCKTSRANIKDSMRNWEMQVTSAVNECQNYTFWKDNF